MPINLNQTKLINILLLSVLIILTLAGILIYHQFGLTNASKNWVLHTFKVQHATSLAQINITDAESRLNYYLLANDPTQVKEILKLLDDNKQNLVLLKQLTNDNPIQQVRVNELEDLMNKKTMMIRQMLSLTKPSDYQTKLNLATSKIRQSIKADILKKISEINQEESNLLEQRNAELIANSKISNLMYIVFVAVSEIFIIITFILLNYYIRQRNIIERKQVQTEEALLKSNEKLKLADERYLRTTEGSSVGLWDWEVGTNHVHYSNYFRKMLGYKKEEFPNTLESFEKVIHPNDHDRVWSMVNLHLEKHAPFKIEYRLRKKSGEYDWFQAAGLALWDKDGKAVRMSGSIINIEDRKKSEQRLNIQFAVTDILTEANNLEDAALQIVREICTNLGWEFGAYWSINHTTGLLDCIGAWHQQPATPLMKIFEEKSRYLHLSTDEGIPGHVLKLGRPIWYEDVDTKLTFARALTAKKVGLNTAFAFPIIIQRNVIGVIECYTISHESVDQDLLDLLMTIGAQIGQFIVRKKVEKDLHEIEIFKSAILETAPDSIITIDEDMKILSFNPQTIIEFNCVREEILGKDISTLIPAFNSNLLKSDKTYIEIEGNRMNGEQFPVELTIAKMSIDNQKLFVIIIRDITERKKGEQMKNEFISIVSHELRTPITSISGSLTLIINGIVGNFSDKAKRLLEIANSNCQRLLLLINDILDIQKIEAGKMNFNLKPIHLNEFLIEAIAVNKVYADKFEIKMHFNQSNKNPEVEVDPDRLMQVITNLLSNAAKFSPKGEEVLITCKSYHNYVRVLVANRGPGIPKEFQSRIFQKFSQADTSSTRAKGGTGLGLSISKAIVEKLGGTLNFISKPGEITTFYFDLPLIESSLKINPEVKRVTSNRILICEDDENQANYINTLLQSAGFQTDIALTVHEAKNLLPKHHYDALLLDLILPDQDGISFIRELRSHKETVNLPIIVLSVVAQIGRNLLNGDAFAIADWLDKPIDYDKLLQVINRIQRTTHPNIPNILHVEDDLDTFNIVKTLISGEGNVVSSTSVKETIEKLKKSKFDLVILDLLLPDGNAEQLIPLIAKYHTPIIVYSAFNLDEKFAKDVKHVLLKSKISNKKLLNLIEHVLEINH